MSLATSRTARANHGDRAVCEGKGALARASRCSPQAPRRHDQYGLDIERERSVAHPENPAREGVHASSVFVAVYTCPR